MNAKVEEELEDILEHYSCDQIEHLDRIDWIKISKWEKLSEDFIREFKDKVNWYWISSNQKLSEDFIIEFKNKVNVEKIFQFQKVSKELIKELLLYNTYG